MRLPAIAFFSDYSSLWILFENDAFLSDYYCVVQNLGKFAEICMNF